MKNDELGGVIDLIYEIDDVMVKLFNTLKKLDEVLLSDDDYDNCTDAMYEAPMIGRVSKRDFYIQYVITKITKGGNIIAKGIGEDYGDEITLSVNDLTYGEAIALLNHFN